MTCKSWWRHISSPTVFSWFLLSDSALGPSAAARARIFRTDRHLLTVPETNIDNSYEQWFPFLAVMYILIHENDHKIRPRIKINCDLDENIVKRLLHQDLSVISFNTENQLIQQRSDAKISFPFCFTSTCSYPLSHKGELEENNAVEIWRAWGKKKKEIRRAAQRPLKTELGISMAQVSPEDTNFKNFIYFLLHPVLVAAAGSFSLQHVGFSLVCGAWA